jgi:hypothetical protein
VQELLPHAIYDGSCEAATSAMYRFDNSLAHLLVMTAAAAMKYAARSEK